MSRYVQGMSPKSDYHHGNLRTALIDAGIAILDEVGWKALSLRGCAAKAGVSHAAPAHHFGNATGLRTALATEAYRRFSDQTDHYVRQVTEDRDMRLRAAGRAYIDFAKENPGLFTLMFGGADLNQDDADLNEQRRRAYDQLGKNIAAFLPEETNEAGDHGLRVAVWSMVHGYAHLILAGQMAPKAHEHASDEALLDALIRMATAYHLK